MEEKHFEECLYYFRLGENLFSDQEFSAQKEKIISLVTQQCNSENLHFLIGSGCSLPAVPLMGQTFSKIKSNKLDESLLGKFGGESKDIEGYLNWLRNAIIFHEEDSEEGEKYKEAFDITKKVLLKTMPLEYKTTSEDNVANQALQNYQNFYSSIFLQREFKKLSPVNIFTTNYDLFNEVSMEHLGIHYTNGFRGSVNRVFDPSIYHLRLVDDENRYKEKWSAVRRFVKLYKIHGSYDWKYDQSLQSIIQTNFSSDFTEDVMIYPTIDKHFETQQTPYSELFREFTINLQKKNSTLIVIGYGFPDEHINQLISQSLNNEDFNLIVFGNKNEHGASRFLEQHKDKHNFHFIGGNLYAENDGHHFKSVIEFLGYGENNEAAD
jgi:hypothetical protein